MSFPLKRTRAIGQRTMGGVKSAKRQKTATQAYVKRLIKRNEEMKYAIIDASYNATTTPGLYCLTNTSQGDSGGTHIGDESVMKNLELRLIASVADATNSVRVILFRWKPNIGYVVPGAGSILKDANSPSKRTSTRSCMTNFSFLLLLEAIQSRFRAEFAGISTFGAISLQAHQIPAT